ncbi:MAG: hypothetical protein HKN44_15050 [Ilumatobacter sp.]|nr:hypothetical protein [Ilumatobacter sp.]
MPQRLKSAALVAIVAMLGWPSHGHLATPGLDPGWRLAGSFAHVRGLRYGDDIVFNFGPLGFVVAPIVGAGRWFILGVAGQAALLIVFALAVFGALRIQGHDRRAAFLATAVLLLLAPTSTSLPELVVLATGTVVVLARWHRVAFGLSAWVGLGGLAATLTLVKISTGPVLLLIVLVSAALDGRRGRALVASAAAFAVTLVGWWLALAQSVGDLGQWVRGALEIGLGHTAAMSLGTPGGAWQYAALLVVLLGSIGVFVVARAGGVGSPSAVRRAEVVGCLAMVTLLGWFFVKQGFVRRDGHAAVFFFAALVALALLVPWRRMSRVPVRLAGGLAVVALVAYFVIDDAGLVARVNPVRPGVDVAQAARRIVSTGARADADLGANRSARADYGLPQTVVDLIGDGPVHVDPWEVTLAWAYGLDWRPIPTLQGYLGYTPYLDERNADALSSPDGPRYVLRTPHGPIDHRFPLTEGPAYHVALMCNFTSVYVDADWQLFERTSPRCGPLVEHETVRVGAGDPIPIVGGDERTAVLIAVEFDRSLLTSLAALVLKPPSSPDLIVDGRSHRMIAATASTPGLVVVPPTAGWGSRIDPFAGTIDEVAVDRGARVTMYTMTVDGRE